MARHHHLDRYRERDPLARVLYPRAPERDLTTTIATHSAYSPPAGRAEARRPEPLLFRDEDVLAQPLTATSRSLREKRQARAVAPATQPRAKPAGSDRRMFHPLGLMSPAASIHGTPAAFNPSSVKRSAAGIEFRRPNQVIPCIQRQVRREVMFALKKAGKGYRKKKRRTWLSEIPC